MSALANTVLGAIGYALLIFGAAYYAAREQWRDVARQRGEAAVRVVREPSPNEERWDLRQIVHVRNPPASFVFLVHVPTNAVHVAYLSRSTWELERWPETASAVLREKCTAEILHVIAEASA